MVGGKNRTAELPRTRLISNSPTLVEGDRLPPYTMDRRKSDTLTATCSGAKPKRIDIRIPLDVGNEYEDEVEELSNRGNLLTVEGSCGLYERRRANSDPNASHIRAFQDSCQLPEITVEDFSDMDKQCMLDKANCTQEGAFFVPSSPPRPRSNTCPDDLFRKKAAARPPTPPPMPGVKKNPFGGLPRHVSRERVSFAPHKLSKLKENPGDSKTVMTPSSKCSAPDRSYGHNSRRGVDHSKNSVTPSHRCTLHATTHDLCEADETVTEHQGLVTSQHMPSVMDITAVTTKQCDPSKSVREQVINVDSMSNCNLDSGVNVGSEISVGFEISVGSEINVGSSVVDVKPNDCVRSHAQTTAPTSADGKQLKAC
jgi:hypothetical protein